MVIKNSNEDFLKLPLKPYFVSLVVVVLFCITSLFIVRETETTFVVRFGKVVRQINGAGLYFKTPLLDKTVAFDKRILQVYSPAKEVIASDQKRLIVDAYAKYRITDTKKFYETLRDERGADVRISAMLDGVVRKVVATNPLLYFLTTRRVQMMESIQTLLAEQTKEFGVTIIDVRIIRADLPVENSDAIFKRMKTEREKEAQELRAQGQQEATIIIASADKEAKEIKSKALMDAQKIMGKADAAATRIYANAFASDPKFFEFYKTMDVYKNSITNKNIVLSTKNNSVLSKLKGDL